MSYLLATFTENVKQIFWGYYKIRRLLQSSPSAKELVAFFMACPFLKTRQCTVIKYMTQSGDGQGCAKYLLQTLESRVWGQTLVYRTSHNFKLTILQLVLLLKLHTRSFLHHHGTGSSLVVWWFCSWFGWQRFKSGLRSARKHCSLQLCGGQTLPLR